MHIQVLIGNADTNGRSQLQQIQDSLVRAGQDFPVIQAGAYAEDGLMTILEVRVNAGQRAILVDDCTKAQILHVLAWQTCLEDDPRFEELTVHLARRETQP